MNTVTLSDDDFTVPVNDRYFEDYIQGAVYEYGYLSVTANDIQEYARKFDPQRLHLDPGFAVSGPFGGLIASGWHTGGLMMRLMVDHYLSGVAGLSSPGADEMRWAYRSAPMTCSGCGPRPCRLGGHAPSPTVASSVRT